MMRAASLDRSPRLQRVQALLSDGVERSTLEIIAKAKVCAVNSCVAELRVNGFRIACRQEVDATGQRRWFYRMMATASAERGRHGVDRDADDGGDQ